MIRVVLVLIMIFMWMMPERRVVFLQLPTPPFDVIGDWHIDVLK
jgi:hypothetical protein